MPGALSESVKLEGANYESRESVKGDEGLNKETVRVSAFSQGCGLTVRGSINSKPVDFLVDTGSAVTVISYAVYDDLGLDQPLESSCHSILLADGSPLGVRGQAVLGVELGEAVIDHPVLVANIEKDAILGMDFLTAQKCTLNLNKSVLRIGDSTLSMWNEYSADARCCRISVEKKVVVPGCSQMNIPSVVHRKGGEARYNVIEGTRVFTSKHGLLVGKSLSDISYGRVQVRVCNPLPEPIEVWPGTTVAIAHPLETEVHSCESQVTLNTIIQNRPPEKVLPKHLQKMVEESSNSLDSEQKQKLWDTIHDYQDVFADSDGELGRTAEAKHKINTGNS